VADVGNSEPDGPFAPRAFIARIEGFAPRQAAPARKSFYSELRRHLAGRSIEGVDGFTFLLHAIVLAHALFASAAAKDREKQKRDSHAAYLKESRRLHDRLTKVGQHPLVRDLAWDFYGPDETCPHGLSRRECEERYERRDTLRLLNAPPLEARVSQRLKTLTERDGALLRQPDSAFCRPVLLPPIPAPPRRRGRPRDSLKVFLDEHGNAPSGDYDPDDDNRGNRA
jgi:hypothetical protein